jgi:hypothetical protein
MEPKLVLKYVPDNTIPMACLNCGDPIRIEPGNGPQRCARCQIQYDNERYRVPLEGVYCTAIIFVLLLAVVAVICL